jgi:hypothetical protein
MQLLTRVLLLAVPVSLVGLAGAAGASTISMVWISTSGIGTGLGTPTLYSASLGDTAVLEIRVQVSTPTTGLQAIGVRFSYNPAVISATHLQMCPATPNNSFGGGSNPLCGALGSNIGGVPGFLPVLTTRLNAAGSPQGAYTGGVVGTVPNAGLANGAYFELAHITFSVLGAGATGAAYFVPGVDGEVPIGGGFSFPQATGAWLDTAPIPEPGTLALLALGLGALALSRTRARRRPRRT